MLFADRAKFLGLVFTITFSAFLITQQVCVFASIMHRTSSQIHEVRDASIWVANPNTQYVDEIWPLSDTDVYRVRSVPGVAWAVPFFKTMAVMKAPSGIFRSCMVLGLDDDSLVGAPQKMLKGTIDNLNQPNAIILDKAGYDFFFPGQPFELGKIFELNDHRAVLAGICDTEPPFQTIPIVYSKYTDAVQFTGQQRRKLSFILAEPKPGLELKAVCLAITKNTGLAAFSAPEFAKKTITYYLKHTGILINFGLTISIAVLVGMVVTGQTFYLFTLENLRQFATLKAIGVSHKQIIHMILLQAVTVGILGYSFGMGLAAWFFYNMQKHEATRSMRLLWEAMAGAGCVTLLIVAAVSILSLRRVLTLEPASVFRS